MGKVSGILSNLKGLVGEAIFKRVNNQTVVYERPDITDSRTLRSVAIRVRMANIAAVYSALKKALTNAFEDAVKPANAYNMFFKHNVKLKNFTPIYLTKTDVANNVAIAAPYIIGQGNLTPIEATISNNMLVSNVSLGDFVITATTTIGELLTVIRNNNRGRFQEFDQITYIALKQCTRNGNPYLKRMVCELYLDAECTDKVWDKDLGSMAFKTQNGYLAADMNFEGAAAWLVTRQLMDKSVLSSNTQFSCNNSLIANYNTKRAFDLAANSYGGYNDVLLTPGNYHEYENEDTPTPTPPTPTTPVTITAKVATGQEAQGTVKAGSSAAGATSSVTVEKDTSVQVVATPASGYKFKKWNTGETTATLNLIANADTTVTATFEPDSPTGTVTVTLTSADASQGKVQINTGEVGATATATVQSGAATVIKAIPEAGYTFSKWSDGGLQFERTINPTEDVSLTATFEAE